MTSDHLARPGVQVALIEWITVRLIGAGLIAWWRRPDSRSGPLMVIAGFATTLSTLQWANARVPYTVGELFDLLVRPRAEDAAAVHRRLAAAGVDVARQEGCIRLSPHLHQHLSRGGRPAPKAGSSVVRSNGQLPEDPGLPVAD